MYADNHTIIKIEMLESLEKYERKTDIAFIVTLHNRCRPIPLLSVHVVLFLNIPKSVGLWLIQFFIDDKERYNLCISLRVDFPRKKTFKASDFSIMKQK